MTETYNDVDASGMIIAYSMLNTEYARKVLPHIKPDYFVNTTERAMFEVLNAHLVEYDVSMNKQEMFSVLKARPDALRMDRNKIVEILSNSSYIPSSHDFAEKMAELWIRRAMTTQVFTSSFTAFSEGGDIAGTSDQFIEAERFRLDSSLGSDFADFKQRHDKYINPMAKLSLMYSSLNAITDGGVEKDALVGLFAGTGAGKSSMLGNLARKYAIGGYKVFYASCEMSEIAVEKRLDAALLEVDVKDLKSIPKAEYESKMEAIISKMKIRGGALHIKQYPTGNCSAMDLRNDIELFKQIHKGIDVVIVDYLGIMKSYRASSNDNNSAKMKLISEELRALAIMSGAPVITAGQITADSQLSTDITLNDLSESKIMSHSFDLMLAMVRNETMTLSNKMMIVQLKNRYGSTGFYNKFYMGYDSARFTMYDLENMGFNPQSSDVSDVNAPSANNPKQKKGKAGKRKSQAEIDNEIPEVTLDFSVTQTMEQFGHSIK